MDFKYNFKDWFCCEWGIKTDFRKKNNSYVFLNLDYQKCEYICVNYLNKKKRYIKFSSIKIKRVYLKPIVI